MPISLNILLCYYAKTSRICAMDIYKAFTQLNSKNQASNFLTDLCTPNELKALEERWEVAKLLASNKYTYREISAKLGASTTTVTRVARFLFDKNNKGYTSLIKVKK